MRIMEEETKKTKTTAKAKTAAKIDAPVCACNTIHEETVTVVRKGLSADAALTDAAELF
jgi:hypothetical protein